MHEIGVRWFFQPRRSCGDAFSAEVDAREVMTRYGCGKTTGYQNLKDRELVPPPVRTHPDRWRPHPVGRRRPSPTHSPGPGCEGPLTHQGRRAATDSTRPSRSSIPRTSVNVAGGLPRESAIRCTAP